MLFPSICWNDPMLSSFLLYWSPPPFQILSLCRVPTRPSPFLHAVLPLISFCTSSILCKIKLFSCSCLYFLLLAFTLAVSTSFFQRKRSLLPLNLLSSSYRWTQNPKLQTSCMSEFDCTLLHFPLWTSPPLSSASALLFLSSLCRWRSRWLARVRELSTLCLFHPLSPISATLFITVLHSG